MVREKTTSTKQKAIMPSKRSAEETAEKERQNEEQWKKSKKDEEGRKQALWERKIESRSFTCERQVDRRKMLNHPFVRLIQSHGLGIFFEPVPGYRKNMVRAFYAKMEIDSEAKRITGIVGSKRVLVTPDVIAEYLRYHRPEADSITYPRHANGWRWHKPIEEIVSAITEGHPDAYDPAEERFIAGSLRENYRAINKMMHYNLAPSSIEKTPTKEDGELLFVFGSEVDRVDWAVYIWNPMRFFREREGQSVNIPFPTMITTLCVNAGCKVQGDPLTLGVPGAITATSLKKSKSLARPQPSGAATASRPTARKGADRVEQWLDFICCRQDTIMASQRRMERRQRRAERSRGRTERKVAWMAEEHAQSTGRRYVPTDEDLENDSESTASEEEAAEGDGDGDDQE